MGTWATHAFGNDYALDWAEDLHETKNMDAVENTLDNALEGDGELAAPFAAEALAAIEVIARLQGHWGRRDEDSERVDQWVGQRPQKARPDLAAKALLVIDRIVSPQSELRAMWADSEHYADWLADVAELKSRITV
jgi:hypothetical protein